MSYIFKIIFLFLSVFLGSNFAFGKKECTQLPEIQWMPEEIFKTWAIKEGYKIKKFKKTGSCYEIYGTNKAGKKIETYFSPIDGKIVKEKILK